MPAKSVALTYEVKACIMYERDRLLRSVDFFFSLKDGTAEKWDFLSESFYVENQLRTVRNSALLGLNACVNINLEGNCKITARLFPPHSRLFCLEYWSKL